MAGDVLELMHLRDDDSLDTSVPYALKRFYVIAEATKAAEGFSPTWYPHLWRCKLQPLVDSQEYKDILDKLSASSDPFAGNINANTNPSIGSVLSTYSKYMSINEAIIEQAEIELPKSGYDTSRYYTVPAEGKELGDPDGVNVADPNVNVATDSLTADSGITSPAGKIQGYLAGDGLAPNGLDVSMGVAFPGSPLKGDYFLRLDFVPNRLFRYDGKRWVKIEDAVRTNLTPGAVDNKTARSVYVNNTNTYTDLQGNTHPQRQSLSKALTPKADN
jgi:hypothetical protein